MPRVPEPGFVILAFFVGVFAGSRRLPGLPPCGLAGMLCGFAEPPLFFGISLNGFLTLEWNA